MKEIFLLTRILLKSSTSDGNQKNKENSNGFGKFFISLLVYGYIIVFITGVSYIAISGLILANQPTIFLNFAFSLFFGFGIIQILITSLNILYFSKDLDFLLPLPVSPQKVILSKLNCLIVYQYKIATLLVLPGLIVYGVLLNLECFYYIISVLTLLLFPLIPVAIISFLVTIIMKFTKIIKNKEIVQYITIFFTLLLIIIVTKISGENSNEELVNVLLETNGKVQTFSKMFPVIDLAIKPILNYNNVSGIINILKFAVLSIAIYYIISFIISKLYIKTVISLITVKNKKSKKIDNLEKIDTNAIFLSYFKKEFKLLVRNPIFFMQCVLPCIIFPIIITVPAIIELKKTTPDIRLLQSDFSNIINTNFGFMGLIITILVFYTFNHTSITAISRDAQNAVFMKYIPISFKKQIIYKIMPGIILNILPIIYVLAFGVIFIPGLEIKNVIYITIVSILINVLNNALMIIVDLKNPKLKWITEQSVVKQNFNIFFAIAFIGIEILLIILLGIHLKDLNYLAITLIVIFTIAIISLKKYIKSNEEKIFDKII